MFVIFLGQKRCQVFVIVLDRQRFPSSGACFGWQEVLSTSKGTVLFLKRKVPGCDKFLQMVPSNGACFGCKEFNT